VPLAAARGLQNKALEAMAAGLPVVLTTVVREGLPSNVEPSCTVADERHDFADAVLALLARTPAERRDAAERADLTSFSWATQLSPLLDMLEAHPSQWRQRIA
jgi:glycosyltransferase involved in cell wall biosynthesis